MNSPLVEVLRTAANELRDGIAWMVAGVASTYLVYTKSRRTAASDSKSTSADSATTTVIELLRTEVNRLAMQNAALAKIVSELQMEVIAVRDENADLRVALQKLTGWENVQQDGKANN